MKQTAVEWLFLMFNNPNSDQVFAKKLFEKAKEMEKEQMRDASCPFIGGWEDDEFEYWYNETYKK